MIGDAGAGKATLWKALLKSQPNSILPRVVKSSPLLYGFLEFDGVDEQSETPQTHRIDLWALQQIDDYEKGNPDGKFLSCVLNPSSIDRTVILLCVDLSSPSDIASSMCGWLKLLESTIESVTTAEQVVCCLYSFLLLCPLIDLIIIAACFAKTEARAKIAQSSSQRQ